MSEHNDWINAAFDLLERRILANAMRKHILLLQDIKPIGDAELVICNGLLARLENET